MRGLQRCGVGVLLVLLGCVSSRQGASVDGQPATQIEAPASDGQSMRLTDYRGKVVLLSFWHGG